MIASVNLTSSPDITVGTMVCRSGTTDPRSCGECTRVVGDYIVVAWAFGGESDLMPVRSFCRLGDGNLKREVARMMLQTRYQSPGGK